MIRATIKVLGFVLVLGLLALPAGLSAKERRGVPVVVTRLDGGQVSGELIAVKPDSLLLLTAEGRDETVALAGIKTVRLVRKVPFVASAVAGFVAGAAVGYSYIKNEADVDSGNIALTSAAFGAAGALAGLAVGVGIGTDAVLRIAGEPAKVVEERLDRLKGRSREGRLRLVPALVKPAAGPEAVLPLALPAGPGRPSRRPRVRLSLGATLGSGANHFTEMSTGTFRFLGDVPAGEAGTYDMPVRLSFRRTGSLGPVSLAYEWTDHWLLEIELFGPGKVLPANGYAILSFVSSTDGKTYVGDAGIAHDASFASLLLGPVFRPLAPSALDRHAVELGIAAGPARVGLDPAVPSDYLTWPAGHKTVLSARVHAAYDFYFVPAVSLGAFVGYRYLEAEFPQVTAAADIGFRDFSGDPSYYPAPSFYRPAELSFPSQTYSMTGVTFGLRLTFRL